MTVNRQCLLSATYPHQIGILFKYQFHYIKLLSILTRFELYLMTHAAFVPQCSLELT